MKVYYAHPVTTYGSMIELDDIRLLQEMGFEVENPNKPEHDGEYRTGGMIYFRDLILGCDLLAFRALADGAIPSGVSHEIEWARTRHMPVFELPTGIVRRTMTVEQTREWLYQAGRR